jgi:hypothetical protein
MKPGVQNPHWKLWLSRKAALKALDGLYLAAIGLHGEHEARSDRFSVQEHGAGSTDPVLATDVGPGQLQVLTEEIDQGPPGLDVALTLHSIDLRLYDVLAHAGAPIREAASCRDLRTRVLVS